jgi:DNA-binding LacI/PurR family transcriptional regulator
MKSGKSRQVGVLVRNNSRIHIAERGAHPLAFEFLLGINQGLENDGYMMSLVRICDVSDTESLTASALQGNLLDGLIIVNTVPSVSIEKVEKMAPAALWLDADVWLPERCLRRDEIHAGMSVGSELAALGYERLIVLTRPTGENSHFSQADRLHGLREAAQKHDLVIEESSFPYGQEDTCWPDLWPRLDPKVAVVALDVYAAVSVMTCAAFNGPRPGQEFGLATCDDSFDTAGLNVKGVSRILFHRFDMGVQAAQMMLQLINQPDVPCPSQLTAGEWVQGISTPCVKGK